MQKKFSLSSVEITDPIDLGSDNQLTFAVSGSGTVQCEVRLTDQGEWFVAQVCEDGLVYSTVTGARSVRFNQTAASGATIVEVTGAKL